ncbi:MAG TPA: ATP-binding cassette domain-containing protein [Chitinophagaceae bacterium]|nr:MAG: ABC transporter [Bacteroidetes bacterium OLB11]HMN32116.1 ATP-binding cassette domain-containing protein [Chitinophagaceae bacterium]
MSISVTQLTKLYGEQTAVNDISFNIQKGEIVGFLGPNGAGKSTTMKIITGYIPSSKGKAFVCEKEVSDNLHFIQQKIGYLPESNPLYFEMYVREYLEFLANVHQIKNVQQRINEVIELTGLNKEEKKKIGALSKGYKQRVGLAQAIIHNPEVLILDEPTSGLDPNQIVEIRELIKNFGKEKTVILSTHIMQEVEAMCDRVIIINKGAIVADSEINELQKQHNQIPLEQIFRNLTLN